MGETAQVIYPLNVLCLPPSSLTRASGSFLAGKLEAKAALNQALEMKRQGKRQKAHKLFLHALKMDPGFVDALNEFGIFSEEDKD